MIWVLGNATLIFDLVLLCLALYFLASFVLNTPYICGFPPLTHKVFFPSSGRTADPSKPSPLEANFKQLSYFEVSLTGFRNVQASEGETEVYTPLDSFISKEN